MDRDDQILAYIQGNLAVADKAAFEETLGQDSNLAAEVRALLAVRSEFARSDRAIDPVAGWKRLEAAIDHQDKKPANTNRPLRLSLWQTGGLIAASLMLWQVAVVPIIKPDADLRYQTVGETLDGPALQIIFLEQANIGAISLLLRELDGNIVAGPSALGLYRLSFTDEERRAAAFALLGTRRDLVESVTIE